MSEEKGIQKHEEAMSPATLIQLAIEKGADLENLEKLLDLQERYDANKAKKAYVKAMASFKENPPRINKDKKVAYKEVKYSHASLANVTDKINKALSEHGLSAAWSMAQNGSVSVTCKITHELGHSEETTLSAPSDTTGSKNAIQAIGSTISYLQRYTLLSLTGLATQEQDDDGKSGGSKYIVGQQLKYIKDLLVEYKADESIFISYIGAESMETIPEAKYSVAVAAIKSKPKKEDKK